MKEFKDTEGRPWQIAVNVDAIKRVRDLCGVNLLAVVEDQFKLLRQLSTDYVLLANVLYVICKPEADTRNVTDEQFGRALSGDALWEGFNALVDDLLAFFPDPRQRKLFQKMIEKIRTAAGMLSDQMERQVDALDLDTVLKASNDSSGNSPASLASTPAP